ncbi:MAG: hypothetical protein EA350_08825 [Gemmatimonadales bacterium]|nr:MAG: hypothetical protein EA350_08825 [Gemmatimonadales bacterium]
MQGSPSSPVAGTWRRVTSTRGSPRRGGLRRGSRVAALAIGSLVTGGGFAGPVTASAQEPGPASSPTADSVADTGSLAEHRELCRLPGQGNDVVDATRRALAESSCTAVLWFDGLFGSERDLASARRTSGGVDLSVRVSEFHGTEPDAGLRLRYDLPNLEERVNVFVGRGDGRDAVQDRERRGVVRQPSGIQEEEDRWIAGLGFLPFERWADAADFRVGVRPATAPVVFAQARFQQRRAAGPWAELNVRQTVFWENRDGFGVTGGADYHHLVGTRHLLHWEAIGTYSQGSEGAEWRSEATAWRRFGGFQSVGLQPFALGATAREVPLEEYGVRARYRRPLGGPTLMGDFVVGYSWPRLDAATPREGSALAGIGVQLVFGPTPR